ncbi:MAG: hypothetical protein ABIA04_13930 [Pseudomonadota bacterium]
MKRQIFFILILISILINSSYACIDLFDAKKQTPDYIKYIDKPFEPLESLENLDFIQELPEISGLELGKKLSTNDRLSRHKNAHAVKTINSENLPSSIPSDPSKLVVLIPKPEFVKQMQIMIVSFERLKYLGIDPKYIPKFYAKTYIDGQIAIVMKKYEIGSKEVRELLITNNFRELFQTPINNKTLDDLLEIQGFLLLNRVKVFDLQFLIDKDGSIVISDPGQCFKPKYIGLRDYVRIGSLTRATEITMKIRKMAQGLYDDITLAMQSGEYDTEIQEQLALTPKSSEDVPECRIIKYSNIYESTSLQYRKDILKAVIGLYNKNTNPNRYALVIHSMTGNFAYDQTLKDLAFLQSIGFNVAINFAKSTHQFDDVLVSILGSEISPSNLNIFIIQSFIKMDFFIRVEEKDEELLIKSPLNLRTQNDLFEIVQLMFLNKIRLYNPLFLIKNNGSIVIQDVDKVETGEIRPEDLIDIVLLLEASEFVYGVDLTR